MECRQTLFTFYSSIALLQDWSLGFLQSKHTLWLTAFFWLCYRHRWPFISIVGLLSAESRGKAFQWRQACSCWQRLTGKLNRIKPTFHLVENCSRKSFLHKCEPARKLNWVLPSSVVAFPHANQMIACVQTLPKERYSLRIVAPFRVLYE